MTTNSSYKMAASQSRSCHEMEGDQSPTPTKAFKEDLMDAIALDQDGTQSLLPSSTLESFQAISF